MVDCTTRIGIASMSICWWRRVWAASCGQSYVTVATLMTGLPCSTLRASSKPLITCIRAISSTAISSPRIFFWTVVAMSNWSVFLALLVIGNDTNCNRVPRLVCSGWFRVLEIVGRYQQDVDFLWHSGIRCTWNHLEQRSRSGCRLLVFGHSHLWIADGNVSHELFFL